MDGSKTQQYAQHLSTFLLPALEAARQAVAHTEFDIAE